MEHQFINLKIIIILKKDGEHILKLKKDLYLNDNVDTKEWDKNNRKKL